jgi:hypothetical protein
MALATFGAKQRFQPFMAEYKHWIGIDDQLCFFGRNTPHHQLFWLKQVQVILFPVSLNRLVWVRRTEQRTLFGPSLATRGGCKCLLLLSQVESSGFLVVMATTDQKIHPKTFLIQNPYKKHG